ncbi:unnamed protein product [Phaedon cochleariae]|uniref:Uncharacterized protein n=1 Tax=Phaedon cochleariae TaxID=80249 RepID=A0A9N9SKA9_PHACE|nr:unnamed protein product [Phaedon cochleariae]
MIRVCLSTLIFLAQLSIIKSEGCDSFRSTNVSARVNKKSSFYVVNGCLEPKEFENKKIKEVVVNSGITRLGKDSIRNLPKLESIDIRKNSLEILEPQAFKNVPSLKYVFIIQTNLEEIPKDVFNLVPTITNLMLSSNKIDFIATGAFSNMESLEQIDLFGNKLTYWNREWFQNCPNLQDINFYGNNIYTIPRRAFASLPKLTVIAFGGNKIATIEPGAFRNLKNLTYLNLERNGLTVLDERAFPNKIFIESLYINNNHLNYLPVKLLRKLSVGEIIMDENPWKCPCLQRIHDWLYFGSGSVRPSVHNCRTPYDPICVVSPDKACQEDVEEEMTRRYIRVMRNLTESLGRDMIRVCWSTIIGLTQLSTIKTDGCDSLKITNVSATVNEKYSFYVMNGCLEPEFEDVFNLVPTITNLMLSYNKIYFIASGAFSNMISLQQIDLDGNTLTYFNREWFQNCPNLQDISFFGNKFSTIPRRAFVSLPKLSVITFGGNKIATIEPDAFQNLESLTYLNLERNGLTMLDERAFPNRIYIKSLYINNNHLNYLPGQLLRKLSVREIIMDENPWKCPCLQRIHDWLYFSSGSVRPSVHHCRTPYDPICVVSPEKACQERVEEEMTRRFIGVLRNLTEPLGEACVFLFS